MVPIGKLIFSYNKCAVMSSNSLITNISTEKKNRTPQYYHSQIFVFSIEMGISMQKIADTLKSYQYRGNYVACRKQIINS